MYLPSVLLRGAISHFTTNVSCDANLYDPSKLNENKIELSAMYIACTCKKDKNIIYILILNEINNN